MDLISIIIPMYNSEKYIEKCLKSIQEQTYKNFEVLIINDGSKDSSESIVEKFLKDERFKLFNRTNHGIGASRNFGIENSKGKYICFIDSDDYIDKKYLEKLYNKIKKDKLDLVICNYIELNKELKYSKNINICEFKNTILKESADLLLKINKSPWNKLYKKSIIKDIKFPEKLKYEDTEFLCKVLLKGKIGYIKDNLYYYVIHKQSETTTMDKRVFDILNILDNINKYYIDSTVNIKNHLNQMNLQILTTYTIQQRYQKDKHLRKKFIDDAFRLMKKIDVNYKNNCYFKTRPLLKRIIEKNKYLTLLYCNIYNLFH